MAMLRIRAGVTREVLREVPLSGNPGTALYEDNMKVLWARIGAFCRTSPTIQMQGSYILETSTRKETPLGPIIVVDAGKYNV